MKQPTTSRLIKPLTKRQKQSIPDRVAISIMINSGNRQILFQSNQNSKKTILDVLCATIEQIEALEVVK